MSESLNVLGDTVDMRLAQPFDFDVALSYASEDRQYVEQVAHLLRRAGIRVFYDAFATAELWGNDLYVLLDEVYRKRARFAIIFVSKYYAGKPWTSHERQSVQARAMSEFESYLLPVRLDDAEIPGLLPTISYIDARNTPTDQLVRLVAQKLASAPGVTAVSPPRIWRTPRSREEQRELLAQRPSAWEYLLYASELWLCREKLEPRWRDHELGYARRGGRHLDDREAFGFLSECLNDMAACGPALLKMLEPKAQVRAFGAPGESGDPVLIEHIANRFVGVYGDMLETAFTLRGARASQDIVPLFEAAALLADTPLRQIREFIDRVVFECDRIPGLLATQGDPIEITLTLTLTIDEEALKSLQKEQRRVQRLLSK